MPDYEIETTGSLEIAVETSTHGFPPWLELRATGLRGAPDVFVRVEMRDNVPEVTEFSMRAKSNGRAVRTSDLSVWQPFEGLALNRMRMAAVRHDQSAFVRGPANEREFHKLGGELQQAQDLKRGPSAAELEQVAEVYRTSLHEKPTEAVEVQMGYSSRRTAARRVQQARAAGYLPTTTAGKKNA